MKITITILILAGIVFGCSRKTVASSDEIVISNKTSTETKTSNAELTSAGQTLYTNRCGRCHGLKNTENYTQQRWENILKTMIPKARLNDEEAKQVTAYVLANAKGPYPTSPNR
jgi:mono/diheme cytochrome c family protein